MSYHFFVPGIPVPQPRVKAARRGGFVRIYTPSNADAWKEQIRVVSRKHMPSDKLMGPLYLRLLFAMPRPQSLSGKAYAEELTRPHSSRPDVDNLAKAVMDAMDEWWGDDALVTMLQASKWYARVGAEPGVEITLAEIQTDPCRSRKVLLPKRSQKTSRV